MEKVVGAFPWADPEFIDKLQHIYEKGVTSPGNS
jgi:hypothetical protein